MKRKVWLSFYLSCSLLLNACAFAIPWNSKRADVQPDTMAEVSDMEEQDTLGMTPDFSYEKEEQIPHIRVNCIGYFLDEKKTVYVIGAELQPEFYIKDLNKDEFVYRGKLIKTGALWEDQDIYSGDFTDLSKEGEYVIYQSDVGYSDSFSVSAAVYGDVLKSLRSDIRSYPYTEIDTVSYVLANFLLTTEIYEDVKEDDAFMLIQIKRLLQAQDEKTGAFCQNYKKKEGEEGNISLSATAEASGVLAQYAYYCMDNDPEFALSCRRASIKAYSYIEKYRDNISTDIWYYAAAQLYRLTGSYKYRSAIREYDAIPETSKTVTEYDYTILADLAYLSTTYKTDLTRCETVMNKYMDRAQDISVHSSRENFYVWKDADEMSDKELLNDMMILGIVNYVLSGREYAGIKQNYIHYFLGVNANAHVRLYPEGYKEPGKAFDNDVIRMSEFLFILTQ